jgi:hypothetical protein
VTRDAGQLAEQLGVRIFTADIIYHLFDQFTAYLKQVRPTLSPQDQPWTRGKCRPGMRRWPSISCHHARSSLRHGRRSWQLQCSAPPQGSW